MNFRKATLILICVVLLSGLHLFIYTQNIKLKYRANDLKIRLDELRGQNRLLGSRVAEKENLGYIEKFARERLNMIYPDKINYILVTPEAAGN